MTRFSYSSLSFALLLLLLIPGLVSAQGRVNVAPGFGTLNAAVAANGAGTTFVLQRGGLYLLDGGLETSYAMSIIAATGTGNRPVIRSAVASGGVSPEQVLRPRASIAFKSIRIEGVDELGGFILRLIRLSENNVTLKLEDCVLNRASQAAVRIDGSNTKIHVLNTVISNIGTTESVDNGRGFDDRGNDIDSLTVVNSIFYNLTSRVLRDGGGNINFAKFDHNTFYNTGFYAVSFGPTRRAIFTNNLVINGGFLGLNAARDNEVVEVQAVTGENLTATIRNNAFYTAPDVLAAQGANNRVPIFDAGAQAAVTGAGTGGTNVVLSAAVSFVDAPPSPAAITTSYRSNPAGPQAQFNLSNEPFDFSYSTTEAVYTAGEDGTPLGSLMPFGVFSVAAENAPSSNALALTAAPNPFRTNTTLRYTLATPSTVRLDVFDVVGRLLGSVDVGQVAPGEHTLPFSGTSLGAGVFVLRLTAGGVVSTSLVTRAD